MKTENSVNCGNKNEKVSFRCTSEEKDSLYMQAKLQGYQALSNYIRKQLFHPGSNERIFDAEIAKILRDMEYNNLKVGVNINQIARVCNSKKYVAQQDLEDLKKELNLLHHNYRELHSLLLEHQKCGKRKDREMHEEE